MHVFHPHNKQYSRVISAAKKMSDVLPVKVASDLIPIFQVATGWWMRKGNVCYEEMTSYYNTCA